MNLEKAKFTFIEMKKEGTAEIGRFRCNALPFDMYMIKIKGNREQRRAGFKPQVLFEFEIDGQMGRRLKGWDELKRALKELGLTDLRGEIVASKILGMPGI